MKACSANHAAITPRNSQNSDIFFSFAIGLTLCWNAKPVCSDLSQDAAQYRQPSMEDRTEARSADSRGDRNPAGRHPIQACRPPTCHRTYTYLYRNLTICQ